MVQHKAFGKGMILSIQKMGGDALVEIAFDNVGTKRRMMSRAADAYDEDFLKGIVCLLIFYSPPPGGR